MIDVDTIRATYETDGVVGEVPILTTEESVDHRRRLEAGEAQFGSSLHYINKVHTAMASPFEIVTSDVVLDIVEALIGPNILLYNSNYIIKEPHTEAYIAWHQDLTYWGLADDDAQVSMWLALAPATAASGCMEFVPGTHTAGRAEHVERPDDNAILLLGQQIEGVDESKGRPYELAPGQASFHHGWTIHTSKPNTTDDRRIGLNVQYVAPHNNQAGAATTATLVRGVDDYGYYDTEPAPTSEFDSGRLSDLLAADKRMKDSFQTK